MWTGPHSAPTAAEPVAAKGPTHLEREVDGLRTDLHGLRADLHGLRHELPTIVGEVMRDVLRERDKKR